MPVDISATNPIHVKTSADLANALNTVNSATSAPEVIIEIDDNITLSGQLPAINPSVKNIRITIKSNSGATIDGGGQYCGFIILNGSVTLQNLVIKNMASKGATSCLGAGGGLFVVNTSSYSKAEQYTPVVRLWNVDFQKCLAVGGDGYQARGGGGGAGANVMGAGVDGSPGESGEPAHNQVTLKFTDTYNVFRNNIIGSFGLTAIPGYGSLGGNGAQRQTDPSPGVGGVSGAGQSGYGAGAGAGAAGGGGGGCGAYVGGTPMSGSPGAAGGSGGGSQGKPGFGGGAAGGAGSGNSGSPAYGDGDGINGLHGGNGGAGGNGAMSGGGAGFGGGIFLMDNANITISGSGSMDSNLAKGGAPNGSSSGPDIFMQGNGTITFNTPFNETYTISGGICDEMGAVRHGQATSVVCNQLNGDSMPIGGCIGGVTGKEGIWSLVQQGSGTVKITGQNYLSGHLKAQNGIIDLSSSYGVGHYAVILEEGCLSHTPDSAAPETGMGILSLDSSSYIRLNGYSRLITSSIKSDGVLKIVLEPDGFEKGKEVTLITSKEPIDKTLKVDVPSGYSCITDRHSICITRNG